MEMDKNAEKVEQTATEAPEDQAQAENQTDEAQSEKKFSQDEVNSIVQKRLDRERKRYDLLTGDADTLRQNLIERERAIAERERRADARERLAEKGMPVGFADIIDCSSAAAYEKALDRIIKELDALSKKHINELFTKNGRIPTVSSSVSYSDPLKEAFRPKER